MRQSIHTERTSRHIQLFIDRNVTSKISNQLGNTIRRSTWKETCFLHLRSDEDIQTSLHEILYIFQTGQLWLTNDFNLFIFKMKYDLDVDIIKVNY